MALNICGRLGGSSLLGNLEKLRSGITKVQYTTAMPKIVLKKYEEPAPEHHDDRNIRLARPLSPHLTIYKFQLPAVLSITHRASGMMLSGYATVLGIGALTLPYDMSHYISVIESMNLSPATLFLAKFIIAAPFGYHFANGIRHLYWDTAKGLTMKEVYVTGYSMLAITLASTFLLACL
ncbi:succinate dehydrogenase cytochrome b560 subunit, mitochondrial-like [Aricia agestis]|uniref:succinate dehydrogenase cytochrome b560 subunit, mitochondrial-like n=1 Tax=Aricia agestis TaxID=91739 RepID=UPI001C2017DE|nr:succinate dehydrogenase cytochrome b560 subunit, mitochondrial-like [Aricia agestis]